MKNSIRLALAALALVLTALASTPKPAHALPVCNNINGRACFAPGKIWQCTWVGGAPGWCFCDPDTLTWEC